MTSDDGARLAPGHVVAGKFTVLSWLRRAGDADVYEAIFEPSQEAWLEVSAPTMSRVEALEALRHRKEVTNALPQSAALHVLEVGVDDDGTPYAATESCAYPSLAQLVALCPLAPDEVKTFVDELTRVLAPLHEKNIAHGALTAETVFVGPPPGFAVRVTGIRGTDDVSTDRAAIACLTDFARAPEPEPAPAPAPAPVPEPPPAPALAPATATAPAHATAPASAASEPLFYLTRSRALALGGAALGVIAVAILVAVIATRSRRITAGADADADAGAVAVAGADADSGAVPTASVVASTTLLVTCRPACESVYVDGRSVVTMRDPYAVSPGWHLVAGNRKNYVSQTTRVKVADGEAREVTLTLIPKPPGKPR